MELAPLDQRAAIRPGRRAELDGTSGGMPEARCGWTTRPAADIAPEQLAGNASLTEAQKIAEGARQFEALLLRQILQQTQKTVIQSKFSDTSTTASIYRDLVTQQLAESISKSGSLGLAKSLEGQLTHQLHPSSPAGQNPDLTATSTSPLKDQRAAIRAGRRVSPHETSVGMPEARRAWATRPAADIAARPISSDTPAASLPSRRVPRDRGVVAISAHRP